LLRHAQREKKKEVAHLRRQKADYVRGNAMYKDNERVKKRKRRREKERQQVSLYPSRERSIPTHPTHLRKVIDLAPSLLTRCISILSACLRKLISILADIRTDDDSIAESLPRGGPFQGDLRN